jgi:hypothetical protein
MGTLNITRKRTGCLPCRFRRKKCDERKPGCLGCYRNGLSCIWPVPKAERDTTDTRKRLLPAAKTPSLVQKPGPFQSDNLQLVYSAQTIPAALSARPDILRTHHGSTLFQLFVEHTADNLTSRDGPNNTWRTCFLPLSMCDSRILSGLLALSGAHLATGDLSVHARTHYAIALKSVMNSMHELVQGDTSNILSVLVTALVLCHFEVRLNHIYSEDKTSEVHV